VTDFLVANPHAHLHYTPTNASWLNQVELFFSIQERRLLRHGEFHCVDELAERIIAFIRTATAERRRSVGPTTAAL
jgi:transposase